MEADLESLQGQAAFHGFTPEQLEAFFEIAKTVQVAAGTRIVAAGERADCFFILAKGTLDVVVESDGKAVSVAQIGAGQIVGEMSLIYRQKERQSDVVALSDCDLWRFDFADLEQLERSSPAFAKRFNANLARIVATRGRQTATAGGSPSEDNLLMMRFSRADRDLLRRTALFSSFTAAELERVKDLIEPVLVNQGETIARVGEAADCFYVVAGGLVEVQIEKAGRTFPIARTGPGQVLGEVALIYQQKTRSASMVAVAPCRLLKMGFAEFLGLLTKEPEIGKKLRINLARIAAARALSLSEAAPFHL